MVQVVAQRGPLAVNVNSILWHDYAGKFCVLFSNYRLQFSESDMLIVLIYINQNGNKCPTLLKDYCSRKGLPNARLEL